MYLKIYFELLIISSSLTTSKMGLFGSYYMISMRDSCINFSIRSNDSFWTSLSICLILRIRLFEFLPRLPASSDWSSDLSICEMHIYSSFASYIFWFLNTHLDMHLTNKSKSFFSFGNISSRYAQFCT